MKAANFDCYISAISKHVDLVKVQTYIYAVSVCDTWKKKVSNIHFDKIRK